MNKQDEQRCEWEAFEKTIQDIDGIEVQAIKQKARMVSEISRRRRWLGLTQAEVADRAGLKQSQIARLEGSAQIPRFDTLQKVACVLGLRFELVPDDVTGEEAAAASEESKVLKMGV